MFSALTYAEDGSGKESFNLSNIIDEMLVQADSLNFGGIDRAVVLRACLTVLGEEVYSTDWTRMGADKRAELTNRLPTIVKETNTALSLSINFLADMGIKTDRLLPYAMQLVILTAFFFKCPQPSTNQKAFLRRWIWVSSFAGLLATNPSRLEALIKEFRNVITKQDNPSTLGYMKMEEQALPFPKRFNMDSARVRSLLNVLISFRPRDNQGQEIPEPWKMIREHGPTSFGRIFATVEDKDLRLQPRQPSFPDRRERPELKLKTGCKAVIT